MRIVQSGEIGEVRYFSSTFSQDVKEGDIRLSPLTKGGGSVYDMGIYCINAARYLFRAEPTEVIAYSASREDARFEDCDEMTSATLFFPGDRLAQFTSSFGAADVSSYRIVGTKGDIRMQPAYGYVGELVMEVTVDGETRRRAFGPHDQFAPELIHFSDCVLDDREPEPNGHEGLADVQIIRAIYESAGAGRVVRLEPVGSQKRPGPGQVSKLPPVEEPDLVKVSAPSEPKPE